MRPRILLVDDHEIVRKGIKELLEGPTRDVCGEAATGQEAIEKVLQLKPDLVVMDYFMPGLNGIQTMLKIREIAPTTKIVFLTMDENAMQEAKAAGADACVDKASVVSELHQAIAKILLGQALSDGW